MSSRPSETSNVDLVLRKQLVTTALADVDDDGIRRNQRENRVAYQRVMEDHLRLLQETMSFYGKPVRITGAGANKKHLVKNSVHWACAPGLCARVKRWRSQGERCDGECSCAAADRGSD